MPPGAASRVGGQENSFHRAEVRKGFSDRLLRQFSLWGVVVLELCTINSSGGGRVCWGVYGADLGRSGEPAGHGGGQFNSIEMTAVEMITCQSIQSQLQVQQWLVNRPLYLENTRMKHTNDLNVTERCRKPGEGSPWCSVPARLGHSELPGPAQLPPAAQTGSLHEAEDRR